MNVSIEWTYRAHKSKKTVAMTSEWISAEEALVLSLDIERTGRAAAIVFRDETGGEWNKKELQKYTEEVEEEPHNVTVYFDGGYRKEEQTAGLGIVLFFERNGKTYRMRKNRFLEHIESNNEAEFAAIWMGIRELEELGVHHLPVVFRGDSQVVMNQLAGEWPSLGAVNNWLDRVESKLNEMGIRPIYEGISRQDNKEADNLASQALKGEMISSLLEI
ncbi:reverse transcriptase-like protein [Aneurinibacillus sp. Ricciae_BoGa-3]|uniref:reverse transcriptase-like protein n=1 Tax=Aneurinibacillus sp. Ricciae_BoGa-3 TaxID=3022697 RepID=UPI0023410ACA|nr:reverse transcriptase-like protein [Aneurinibacillus sp. Ricciae_BoGa-3]WCK52692.1 reverse transcriptase-like protein [Aneurinibacillus sp. Ricciae_BoGa-3]